MTSAGAVPDLTAAADVLDRTTVGVLRDALTAEGHPDIPVGRIFAVLQKHLRGLRARWVAEALEAAANEWGPDVLDDSGRSISATLRSLAAEYRDGGR